MNDGHGKGTASLPDFSQSIDDWQYQDQQQKWDSEQHPERFLNWEDLEPYRITTETPIERTDPVITICGASFAKKKNLSAVSAPSKAGKTGVISAFIAGAIAPDGVFDGFPDISVQPNNEGRAVIHIDTEQADEDHQDNIKAIIRRAGIDKEPDYFLSFNIRPLSLNDYQAFTNKLFDEAAERFGGIHSVFIDGGADYISGVNDEETAKAAVKYFIDLATSYACPVITVIHLNPGSDKERGHFGSELQRKSYGLITIGRDGDISTLAPKMLRRGGYGAQPITYTWSEEKRYHIQIDGTVRSGSTKKLEDAKVQVKQCVKPGESLTHTEAKERVQTGLTIGETAAKTRVKDWTAWGLLLKGEDGRYRLNMDKVT